MSGRSTEPETPKKRVDSTIGTALLIVAFINGGLNAAISKAVSQRGVSNPGVQGRLEFAGLFASTFALSVTMTLAVVVLIVPKVYGREWPWQLPILVIGLGAPLAGLPVTHPNGAGALNHTIDSLRAFMLHYGDSFYSGVVVGVASGVIIAVVARHERRAAALAQADQKELERTRKAARKQSDDPSAVAQMEQFTLFRGRPPKPWGFDLVVLVVVILALTIAAERGLATSASPGPSTTAPQPTRDYAAEARAAYLRDAEAACGRWVAQAPRGPSPNEARAWMQWAGNEIQLRKGMHADWQQVPAPEAIRHEVHSIMTDLVGAHNEFIAAVNDFGARRDHWPAVERYKRANTAAVARARQFGFTAGGCGYEWVVY
ncbi:hypothetical protein [Lentzea flava]|uniref:Uncharacterized protein n=1 Tax=Lentzea flava TaxID=103732 RepID=A0ABQ2UE51_9PSEU|nr:hypothetical protein [Lentzea flava]MCP2198338.1 hypothetical protein [Lentzea flava]GGU25131.1 hypothetical protein GCM10010178_16630 [Lentzea flava]